jgi:hypothetical protein
MLSCVFSRAVNLKTIGQARFCKPAHYSEGIFAEYVFSATTVVSGFVLVCHIPVLYVMNGLPFLVWPLFNFLHVSQERSCLPPLPWLKSWNFLQIPAFPGSASGPSSGASMGKSRRFAADSRWVSSAAPAFLCVLLLYVLCVPSLYWWRGAARWDEAATMEGPSVESKSTCVLWHLGLEVTTTRTLLRDTY